MTGGWIGVACAAHVRLGRAGGFMQIGHGKGAPSRRLRPNDPIIYYSPTVALSDASRVRAFTAIGLVVDRPPYQADMGNGFQPFRRDVTWLPARETPIEPLLDRLEFTKGKRNWGYQLRLGLFPISDHDVTMIASAAGATLPR